MKLKSLTLALTVASVPSVAVAQTPHLDQRREAVEKYIASEKVDEAVIRTIWLSAWFHTINHICGPDYVKRDSAVELTDTNYSVFAEARGMKKADFIAWVSFEASKLRDVLVAYPEEAFISCRDFDKSKTK